MSLSSDASAGDFVRCVVKGSQQRAEVLKRDVSRVRVGLVSGDTTWIQIDAVQAVLHGEEAADAAKAMKAAKLARAEAAARDLAVQGRF